MNNLPKTTYEKEFIKLFAEYYSELSVADIISKLQDMRTISETALKAAVIRHFVEDLVAKGSKKIDSMWEASAHFCCSYELVRKCMYYNTNINFKS